MTPAGDEFETEAGGGGRMASGGGRTCRICLAAEPAAGDDGLVAPCVCRGSHAFVHRDCAWTWRHQFPPGDPRYAVCGICLTAYSAALGPDPSPTTPAPVHPTCAGERLVFVTMVAAANVVIFGWACVSWGPDVASAAVAPFHYGVLTVHSVNFLTLALLPLFCRRDPGRTQITGFAFAGAAGLVGGWVALSMNAFVVLFCVTAVGGGVVIPSLLGSAHPNCARGPTVPAPVPVPVRVLVQA